MAKNIKVTLIKSTIGGTKKQIANVRSLGLTKLHQSKILADTPVARGMANKVCHLVKVEEVD